MQTASTSSAKAGSDRALTRSQAEAAIAQRLHALGHPPDLLDRQAVGCLVGFARGSERQLRADLAAVLFVASTEDAPSVNADMVTRALQTGREPDRVAARARWASAWRQAWARVTPARRATARSDIWRDDFRLSLAAACIAALASVVFVTYERSGHGGGSAQPLWADRFAARKKAPDASLASPPPATAPDQAASTAGSAAQGGQRLASAALSPGQPHAAAPVFGAEPPVSGTARQAGVTRPGRSVRAQPQADEPAAAAPSLPAQGAPFVNGTSLNGTPDNSTPARGASANAHSASSSPASDTSANDASSNAPSAGGAPASGTSTIGTDAAAPTQAEVAGLRQLQASASTGGGHPAALPNQPGNPAAETTQAAERDASVASPPTQLTPQATSPAASSHAPATSPAPASSASASMPAASSVVASAGSAAATPALSAYPPPVSVRTLPVPPSASDPHTRQPEAGRLRTAAPAAVLLLYPDRDAAALRRLRPLAIRLQEEGITNIRARPTRALPARRAISYFYTDDEALAHVIAETLSKADWPRLDGNSLQPSLVLLPPGLHPRRPGTIEIQLP